MNWIGVSRASGALGLVVAAWALVFVFGLAVTGQVEAAAPFVFCAVSCGFVGGALWAVSAGHPLRAHPQDVVIILLVLWAGVPMMAAAPLTDTATLKGIIGGYFHAVSAFTTTGYPPSWADTAPPGRVLWWNILQWTGGAVTLLCALLALAALNVIGPGVHRSRLLTVEPGDIFARLGSVAAPVMGVYAAATLGVAVLALLGGTAFWDALCTGMASVSTGGLLLTSGATSAQSLSLTAVLAAGAGLTFGALSFAMHWEVLRGRGRWFFLRDGEVVTFAAIVAAVFIAILVLDTPFSPAEGVRMAFEAVALAATAGWDAGPLGASVIGAPLVIAVITVGGAAVSTAGGAKLRRVVLLARQLGVEMHRLAHPASVAELEARAVRPGSDPVFALGIYIAAYLAAAAVLTLGFAALGAQLSAAVSTSVSALANAGPALTVAAGAESLYLLDGAAARLLACVGMVLGRLEVVVAFTLITTAFWRR